MDGTADRRQRGIVIEAEARQQHLERHQVADVGKIRAVEIESEGTFRTVARAIDPDEFRLAIEESPDQPRAGHAIHPEILARRPDSIAELCRVEPAYLAFRRMRFS